MSLSSALLRGVAGRRFAIRSTTEWLSQTIQTFWGDSSVCLFDCLHFDMKWQGPFAGRYGIGMMNCSITQVVIGNQDASSANCSTICRRAIRVDY